MIIVGALNISNSLDAVHGLAVASCPGQSMLVLCRALECFFCWHCGVLRAESLGGWRAARETVCPRGPGGAISLASGPWTRWQLCSSSPGRERTMSTEAEPEMRANRPLGSSTGKEGEK